MFTVCTLFDTGSFTRLAAVLSAYETAIQISTYIIKTRTHGRWKREKLGRKGLARCQYVHDMPVLDNI